MSSSASPLDRTFEPHEVALAIAFSAAVLSGFFTLLVLAGQSKSHVPAAPPPAPSTIPIAVRPVLDELPLLKLGGKKVRPKLPEMWKKNPPVQRYEATSAPSTKASKTPDAIPSTPLPKPDASAPPPDAEVAKQVDQVLLDAGPDAAPTVEGEGSPDGVKEGTETDPLKARAVSAYRAKILAWFNARFRPPTGEIPCAELKKLTSRVVVAVGQDRRVTSYEVVSPSGNSIFDERTRSTMDRIVGEELPPPPPLYPDILGTTQPVSFSGRSAQCNDTAPNPSPQPPSSPESPAAPAPAPPPPSEPAPPSEPPSPAEP
ncbi:MAG TPA: energy transducer TonB [Polyangiaceae bacterium]|nr:energy transducer TonB [Polyangiaceae bacterium]